MGPTDAKRVALRVDTKRVPLRADTQIGLERVPLRVDMEKSQDPKTSAQPKLAKK